MLDYTVLRNKGKKFHKEMNVFDVRRAIDEILEIQIHKVLMKNIDVRTEYMNFKNFSIKSDMKRL